jgi:hypothetical protein
MSFISLQYDSFGPTTSVTDDVSKSTVHVRTTPSKKTRRRSSRGRVNTFAGVWYAIAS